MESKKNQSETRKDLEKRNLAVDERDYSFDYIKAFLIFSVVYAHYLRVSETFTISSVGGVLYLTSFSYIMQGFLFVAGHFSKNVEKCRNTAFQTFLFPYIILMPLMFFLRYLIFGHAHLDMTLPTMALWYLLTMFYYRFLLKDLIRIKWVLLISIVAALAAGFIAPLDVTLASGRAFGFLPFFFDGILLQGGTASKDPSCPEVDFLSFTDSFIGLCGLYGVFQVDSNLSTVLQILVSFHPPQ